MTSTFSATPTGAGGMPAPDSSALWGMVRRAGLTAVPMDEAAADWDTVLATASQVPARYTRSMVSYQRTYAAASAECLHDLSMVLHLDRGPVGVWPLMVLQTGERWSCETLAGEVHPPLFVGDLSEKRCKPLIHACREALESLCRATGQATWRGAASVGPEGVDLWHRHVMARGAQARVTHELFCDLSLGMDEIRRNLRKSYKSLLASGARLWQTSVLDRITPETFAEFQALHAHVAGRVTRPQATWDLQAGAINDGCAFLVVLRDDAGTMVGAGFFTVSRSEALYAVGAYDRSLFRFPLGHVVQINAIEYMKRLGLRWYRLGDRPYPGDTDKPTQKEVDIAAFKEGFATHVFLKVHTVSAVPG